MAVDQAESGMLLSIGEVAKRLDRVPHTIRVWEYKKMLPEDLMPQRDDKGRRYWTEAQYSKICQWIIEDKIYRGKHLPHVKNKQILITT